MGPEESEEIIAAANTSNSYILAEAVMKIPSLRNAVKGLYLKLVDEQCSRLCLRTTAEPSVLRVPSAQHKNLVGDGRTSPRCFGLLGCHGHSEAKGQ